MGPFEEITTKPIDIESIVNSIRTLEVIIMILLRFQRQCMRAEIGQHARQIRMRRFAFPALLPPCTTIHNVSPFCLTDHEAPDIPSPVVQSAPPVQSTKRYCEA